MVGLGIFALIAAAIAVSYEILRNRNSNAEAPQDSSGQVGDTITPPEIQPQAQNYSSTALTTGFEDKVSKFAEAIAGAEGFGVPGAIPTVYHNPGDLKPPGGDKTFFPGQTGVGNGGHAIFESDAAGWEALKRQIRFMATNQSHVYSTADSFQSVGKKYAEDSQPWIKNVTAALGVPATMTLQEFFYG